MNTSPFKGPQGQWLTKALFWEQADDRSTAIFTLKKYDHEGCKSLYKLYMSCSDPTEYEFATKYLGGWEHWLLVQKNYLVKDEIPKWRKELEIAIRAKALQDIQVIANDPKHKYHYPALKLLLDKGWNAPSPNSKGRPSKSDVQSEVNRLARENRTIDSDLDRILNLDPTQTKPS